MGCRLGCTRVRCARELKAKPKSEESDKAIAEAVEELKRLKAELAELSKKQVEA